VPTITDELIAQTAELLGARAFLRDVFEHGAFQKLERDHRIVGIFDGSTVVNMSSLINQFTRLGRAYDRRQADRDAVERAANLDASLPQFRPGRLALMSPDGCGVVQMVPELAARLIERGLPEPTAGNVRTFADEVTRVHRSMTAMSPPPRNAGPEAFELARRYEWCFAGAALLHLWESTPGSAGSGWCGGQWLDACLALVVSRLRCGAAGSAGPAFDRVADVLLAVGDPEPWSLMARATSGAPR
jgi:hypothetical protein